MNFKDLQIKKSYINQGTDNFVDCLLNPALKLATTYRRSVGFFSSSVFKLIINALPSFIRNGGKVNLIVSPTLHVDVFVSDCYVTFELRFAVFDGLAFFGNVLKHPYVSVTFAGGRGYK